VGFTTTRLPDSTDEDGLLKDCQRRAFKVGGCREFGEKPAKSYDRPALVCRFGGKMTQ